MYTDSVIPCKYTYSDTLHVYGLRDTVHVHKPNEALESI